MNDTIIRANPDGTLNCLYTEAINLAEIGHLAVKRASHVEWDEAVQAWTVTLADGTVLPERFASRAAAIAAEVAVLQSRL